ncbi:MAG: hypothetical protein K2O67_00935, partial [Clostridia bacterium]|nr:hypothetical protein [Clostridia bacterium]
MYRNDTFIGWFNSGNSSEYISQAEIVHQDSKKEYDIYYGIKLISDYDDYQYSAAEKQELKAKSPYIKADYRVSPEQTKTDVYYFHSEDAAAKTATFKNEAGELLTVNYSELYDYEYYERSGGWGYYGGTESFIVLIVFASLSTVLALLQIIGAFAGKKHRGGNNLCIATGAFMAPALIGLLAFFGGLKGNDAINKKYPEKAKKQGNGFGLRLTFAIIILLFAISYTLGTCLALMSESYLTLMDIMLYSALPGLIIAVLAVLLIIGAVAGKKHKWGNILHIIFGAITAPGYIGLFALVGGINGNKAIADSSVGEKMQEEVPHAVQPVLEKSEAVAETVGNTLADYPVDYVNKPAVSRLLDLDNRENLFLENEDGTAYEFHQLYVTVRQGTIYALTQTVGLNEDMRVVFRVDYASDTFHIEEDEKACEAVWNEYVSAVNVQEEEYVEEYIQPKTSPKAKKGITIAAAVSYGLLLIMGILFAAVPAMSGFFSGLGICADVSARAYGITIGTMWITLATAAGYMFVTISPWSPGKKGKIIIAAISTV